ncbi:hypothetical protein FDP41_000160 [Naegleria fowleri]|uniref:Mif2/CENP-C cupin domain-containing protein n=1 Tax=Naegleria fowleri TaxID=5763 RepID=A0A6A5CCS7_NAEFO|nr:uncharacterized protein FDP41_000160 [Naegleria fowleri]KAF0985121.1 hypothetical protein FDP41_000160 [Naegleria fowleri]
MQNQPNGDGTNTRGTVSNAVGDQQQHTAGGLMPPPASTNTSSSIGTDGTEQRIPRRLLMQAFKRPGTEFVPRERPRESYDDVLAKHTIGKRSGQRLVSVDSDDPFKFFDVNTAQFMNQAQARNDEQSVLSLSTITINDSDSGVSMISSKTGYSVFSSSEEEKSPEKAVTSSTRPQQEIGEPMEEVTSSSEDGGSVKVDTSKAAAKSTVTIRPHVDTPRKQLEISKITTTETEQDKSILEDINKLRSPPNTNTSSAPITDDMEFGNDIGLGFEEAMGFGSEQDEIIDGDIFSSKKKKPKYSQQEQEDSQFSRKSHIQSQEEEETDEQQEQEDEQEQDQEKDQEDEREMRRIEKARRQKSQSEYEENTSYDATPTPRFTLPRNEVDMYQDEADDFSQSVEQSFIAEKYIPREKLDLHDDDLEDDLANEVEEEMERVDPEYEDTQVDLNATHDNTIHEDLVPTQQEKVVVHGSKHDLTIENTRAERLRPRVTKPCNFWENERPIAEETGKLSKIRPLVKQAPPKRKAPTSSNKRRQTSDSSIITLRKGMFDVINENGEEEKVQIAATPEMGQETNFRFKKDNSASGFSTEILPDNSTAKPHMTMVNLLDGKGIVSGTLTIQPGQVKPSTNTGTHSETFYCLSGSVSVKVHTNTPFVLKRGCVLHVPPHNAFSIGNLGKTPCKLFFVFSATEYEEEEEDANQSPQEEMQREEEQDGQQEPNHKTNPPPTDILDESV